MKLRALIVDDEPIARGVLRDELESYPDVTVVGEAGSGPEALLQIVALSPHVIFLDLQMPGMGGFEVISAIPAGDGKPIPAVVVVTAFDQHALRALDAGAVDYLLKPVKEDRLKRSIDRVRQLLSHRGPEPARTLAKLQEVAEPSTRKIVGRLGGEYHLINLSDVLAFQAEGELVWIITAKHRYLAGERLRSLQKRLEGSSFQRVHRGAIVNVDHVSKMAPLSSNRWLVTLTGQQEFVVSKRMAKNVRQILHW